jgi:hypothetical protein
MCPQEIAQLTRIMNNEAEVTSSNPPPPLLCKHVKRKKEKRKKKGNPTMSWDFTKQLVLPQLLCHYKLFQSRVRIYRIVQGTVS